jgi:hypothetical protein
LGFYLILILLTWYYPFSSVPSEVQKKINKFFIPSFVLSGCGIYGASAPPLPVRGPSLLSLCGLVGLFTKPARWNKEERPLFALCSFFVPTTKARETPTRSFAFGCCSLEQPATKGPRRPFFKAPAYEGLLLLEQRASEALPFFPFGNGRGVRAS